MDTLQEIIAGLKDCYTTAPTEINTEIGISIYRIILTLRIKATIANIRFFDAESIFHEVLSDLLCTQSNWCMKTIT